MRTTTGSLNLRSTGRRLVGALSAGAAIAVVGVTARAGRDRDGGRHPPGAGTVSYRHDGTGFVRV